MPLYRGFIDRESKIACFSDHQIFERYAPYPNQLEEVPNNFTIDLMQDYLEKYNNIVSEPQKAGSIDYDIKEIVSVSDSLVSSRFLYKTITNEAFM